MADRQHLQPDQSIPSLTADLDKAIGLLDELNTAKQAALENVGSSIIRRLGIEHRARMERDKIAGFSSVGRSAIAPYKAFDARLDQQTEDYCRYCLDRCEQHAESSDHIKAYLTSPRRRVGILHTYGLSRELLRDFDHLVDPTARVLDNRICEAVVLQSRAPAHTADSRCFGCNGWGNTLFSECCSDSRFVDGACASCHIQGEGFMCNKATTFPVCQGEEAALERYRSMKQQQQDFSREARRRVLDNL